jgi:hypothetical protein
MGLIVQEMIFPWASCLTAARNEATSRLSAGQHYDQCRTAQIQSRWGKDPPLAGKIDEKSLPFPRAALALQISGLSL